MHYEFEHSGISCDVRNNNKSGITHPPPRERITSPELPNGRVRPAGRAAGGSDPARRRVAGWFVLLRLCRGSRGWVPGMWMLEGAMGSDR